MPIQSKRNTGSIHVEFFSLALLSLSLFALGCADVATPNSPIAAPLIQGNVHGGQQPVSGATVQLYAAGANGYGSGAVALLASPVMTDSGGNFTITNSSPCPSPISQLYIVATGGNPGLAAPTNNTSLALMAAIGPCSLNGSQYTINPNLFININEITTVASVYSLAGFMSPDATEIGSGPANSIGIANAFLSVASLANITTGQSHATTPAGNGTVPQAEINTLADIIAPCVNSSGTDTSCSSLFTAATPSGGTAPTNTLQAVYNIATHPGSQVSTLFGLSAATAPFQPSLSSAPGDWTLPVVYTAYGSLQKGIAIDAFGDAWIANEDTSDTIDAGSITELSPNGTILSGSAGFTGGGLVSATSIAIDPSGNAWVSSSGIISKFSNSGTPLSGSTGFAAVSSGPVAIDGLGNVWFPNGIGALGKMDHNGNILSGSGFTAAGLGSITGIAFDGSENVWASSNVNEGTGMSPSYYGGLAKLSNAGAALASATVSFDSAASIAMDNSGDAWVPNIAPPFQSLFKFANDATLLSGSTGFTGGFFSPSHVAIDGAGNAWVTNSTFSGEAQAYLVEMDSSGTVLSGSNGYTVPPGGYSLVGIGIDGSGNVWTAAGSDVVVELIGAATPVVTPLSVGVKNNTTGTRP